MFTVHSASKIPFLFDAVLFWARQLRRISSGRHSRLKDEQKVASSLGERSQDDRVCWSSPAGHIQLSINIHKRMSWCHEARIYWSYRAIAALLIWGGTNTQRNREEMASPPKCEEDLMQLCQIESFTRRFTSPRRDDMLLVLCLNNNVKSSLPSFWAEIFSTYDGSSHLLSDVAVNIKACIKAKKIWHRQFPWKTSGPSFRKTLNR